MTQNNKLEKSSWGRLSYTLMLLLVAILLPGCGGGGGGGSSSTTVTYSGSVNAASISNTNASAIVVGILGSNSGSKTVSPLGGNGSSTTNADPVKRVQRVTQNIGAMLPTKSVSKSISGVNTLATNVNNTLACTTGSITITGTLSDSGLGTLTLTYNNCLLSGETMNGSATVDVKGFDTSLLEITDADIQFTNLTLTGTGLNLGMAGSIRLQQNFTSNTEILTLNVVTQDNIANTKTKTENFVITSVYNNLASPSSATVTYQGRLFDSRYGYVDVATTSPLVYNTLTQQYPSSGGPILITGAGGSSIRINIRSSTDISLSLDLDGDTNFETTRNLLWADLTTTVGSNLGDSDGDGMHDGWELAYSLDPNDPSDAAMDSDLDGATNLQEYQSNTNPISSASTPPKADLSISNTAVSQLLIGIPFDYTIAIHNFGPNAATNVQVTDVLPAGLSAQAIANTGSGSCSGTTTVTCTFPTLYSGGMVTITLTVTSTASGSISNTASVTADEIDRIAGNNSATAVVNITPLRTSTGGGTPAIPAWITYQGNAAHDGYVPITLNPANFTQRWSVNLFSGATLQPVVAADGKVFVSQNSNYAANQSIAALKASDGSVLWTQGYGSISSIDPPAYMNGKVYFQTGGHGDSYLRALDAITGALIFQSVYANQWSRNYAPTPIENDVYTSGGYYGGAYGFDANNGSQKWFTTLNQYDEWTPAVDLNYVYAYTGSYAPGLSVLDRLSGQTVFTIADPSFVWTGWSMNLAPVLGGNQNILATNGKRLISFDLQNKVIGWQLSENFTGQVSVASGKIFVINSGALNVRDEKTGALLWAWAPPASNTISGNIIVTKNHVFVHDASATYAVDLATHLTVWTYPAAGHLTLSNEGALYIAGSNGTLVSISLSGDSDADGMPDWWEKYYGFSDADPADASNDADNDGVSNLQEYINGTNPLSAN